MEGRRIQVLEAAQLRGSQVNISTQTKERLRGSFLFPSLETLSRKKYSFIHPSKKYVLRTYVPRTVKHHTLCALVFLVLCPPGFLQGCLGHKRFTPVTGHTHSDTRCVLSSTGLMWGRQAFSMWSLLLKDSHSCWTFSELSHSWEG